jgi:hypothetical protein
LEQNLNVITDTIAKEYHNPTKLPSSKKDPFGRTSITQWSPQVAAAACVRAVMQNQLLSQDNLRNIPVERLATDFVITTYTPKKLKKRQGRIPVTKDNKPTYKLRAKRVAESLCVHPSDVTAALKMMMKLPAFKSDSNENDNNNNNNSENENENEDSSDDMVIDTE